MIYQLNKEHRTKSHDNCPVRYLIGACMSHIEGLKNVWAIVLAFTILTNFSLHAQNVRNFEYKDIENNIRSFNELKGEKLTLIDFWTTWCKPCNKAIPELNKIYSLYHTKGVAIIGINCDGPRSISKVAPLSKSLQIKYPVLIDINSELKTDLNLIAFPSIIIVNSENKVVWAHEGFVTGDDEIIIAEIEKYLAVKQDEKK